jgi:hypothetical protein
MCYHLYPNVIMKPVTTHKNRLVELLNKMRTTQTGILVSATVLKMNKKDVETKKIPNPFGEIKCVTKKRIEINSKYEDKVNDARLMEEKKVDFQSQARLWGEHESPSIVDYKGEKYIQYVQLEKMGEPIFLDGRGNIIPWERLEPFCPKQPTPKNQGLENPIKVRTMKIDNIIKLELGSILIYEAE